MGVKGKHTENRKYHRYGNRSKAGKYIVQCPYCENNYSVSVDKGHNFCCTNCGGVAGLQHVVKEITMQEEQKDWYTASTMYNDDERVDVREAGNSSGLSAHIRELLEKFIYAVAMNDRNYILANLQFSAMVRSMDEEQRFQRFQRTAMGKYLGNQEIRLQDAAYLSGYPWPEGYDYLQTKLSVADRNGDGIPDDDIRGYQHYEVTLTDGEVFDVYFFEGEDDNWKLRIM